MSRKSALILTLIQQVLLTDPLASRQKRERENAAFKGSVIVSHVMHM